jgi:hypothetical protein
MQYYTLTYDVDSEETGHAYPQAVFKNPKKLEPNPVLLANMALDGAELPSSILPFDYLELNKGAKLTDLMSSSLRGNGFLISKKLRKIIEESNIKDYQFYDVKLFDKEKEIKGYYYFHSTSFLRDYINYKKSKFYIGDIIRTYIRDLNFTPNSFDDLQKHQKSLPYGEEGVCVKQFYLNPNFPYDLELFRLWAYNYSFFINSKLKETLETKNITGLNIQPIDDLIKTPNLA